LTFSSKSLLIVGQGPWSTKVASAIFREDPSVHLQIVGARNLMTNQDLLTKSDFDYVWLCVRPDLQSRILNLFSVTKTIFILEKPFSLTALGYEEIRQSLHFLEGRVRQSRVWRYSPVWRHFIEHRPTNIKEIEIRRGGPSRGSSIPLPEDWISHDLYLLSELVGSDIKELKINFATCKQERFESRISTTRTNMLVKMEIGNFDQKCASWLVHTEENAIKIDFLKSTIKEGDRSQPRKIDGGDAIMAMLNDIENNRQDELNLDFQLQEFFITKVLAQAR